MSTPAPLDLAAALVRELVHGAGALRAQALVSPGPGRGAVVVSCTRLGPLEVVDDERTLELPHDAAADVEVPGLGDLRPLPPFDVDTGRAEVAGVIGGLDLVAEAVRRAAAALGGGAAVVVELATTTPGTDLAVSARDGEAVLVTLGDQSYEL